MERSCSSSFLYNIYFNITELEKKGKIFDPFHDDIV